MLTVFVRDSLKSIRGTPHLHGRILAREELQAEANLGPGLLFLLKKKMWKNIHKIKFTVLTILRHIIQWF